MSISISQRYAVGWFCIALFLSVAMVVVYKRAPQYKKYFAPVTSERKKIIIFTSAAGRGHLSATEALQEYLGDQYELKVVYPVRDILHELDFIHNITGGTYYAEELYNYFLAHKQIGLVRTMVSVGQIFISLRRGAIERLIDNYIETETPDMIISDMPTVNGATQRVAQRRGIPFWVIPTDFDLSGFLFQVYKSNTDSFLVNYPLQDAMVQQTARASRLTATHYTAIGMPVREQFLKTYDKATLKRKYKIPAEKQVIMVMMGGRGNQSIKRFAAELVQIEKPVHYLFCIGQQAALKEPLEMLERAQQVTLSVIEFTPHVAELMAISDLFITKSGGQSISEALYMGLPMLVDATDQPLEWEQLNRILVQKRGWGMLFKRLNRLVPIIEGLLEDPVQIAAWKANIQALQLPNPRDGVRAQVQTLIGA